SRHAHHAEGSGNYTTLTPALRKRVVSYLSKCDPAISGQGGHDDTYWPARVTVWGFDLGPQVGFDVLWEEFNPRGEPAWSEKELRHKCHDADTKPFDKPRGWLLSPGKEFHLTDLGNAQRVIDEHGEDLRYCHPWKSWFVWDGRRWREDDTAEAIRRVKDTQA